MDETPAPTEKKTDTEEWQRDRLTSQRLKDNPIPWARAEWPPPNSPVWPPNKPKADQQTEPETKTKNEKSKRVKA